MKKLIIFLLTLALIGAGIYIYMTQKGHDLDSILNTPDKIDLQVECDAIENLMLTSTVDVTVSNLSSREHKDVTIRVTAYDGDGMILKQKEATFLRTLGAKGALTKTMTLPAKTASCDCIITDSNPQ